ncbi:MAG: NAD-dependent epimerase/dehydratase family protein [Nitrospira sp.]
MTILVTGASGFVGSALVERLAADDASVSVVAAVRRLGVTFPKGVKSIPAGDCTTKISLCLGDVL